MGIWYYWGLRSWHLSARVQNPYGRDLLHLDRLGEVKISTNLMMLKNGRLALTKYCPSQMENSLWLGNENHGCSGRIAGLGTAKSSANCSAFRKRLGSKPGRILTFFHIFALTKRNCLLFLFLRSLRVDLSAGGRTRIDHGQGCEVTCSTFI